MLVLIVSNRTCASRSISRVIFKKTLRIQLDFNTVFHQQTDEQTERLCQILEEKLCVCELNFSSS